MPPLRPKPIVTSWDVFDTLVARFIPNPYAVFDIVQARQNMPDFVRRRLDGQAALDRIGQPYVLHDIYRRMAADGLPPEQARALLRQEVAVEREMLIPIRRNVDRVDPTDVIISDMYLPPELISAFLFETCDLHLHRPIIRSNWGKHSGTIWPLVLSAYVVRRHVGDNPDADGRVPSRFKIACELVQDSQFTAWEQKLNERGLAQFALVQREVRLRCTPPQPTPFHAAVVGPYLTLLICVALQLPQRFGMTAEFAFLSRSADDLARVFAAMFPDIPARNIDISRRLAGDDRLDALFAAAITPDTVVVDMVATGRTFLRFAERNANPGRGFVAVVFLELLLKGTEREWIEQRIAQERFQVLCRLSGGGLQHWHLEHLFQAPYPPVADVALDPQSGGVVRSFGAGDLDSGEAALIGWKSGVITQLVRTLQRRGFNDPGPAPVIAAMEQAIRDILARPEIMAPFTSFRARESMDWA